MILQLPRSFPLVKFLFYTVLLALQYITTTFFDATEKEHLDLRHELESQIRDKDEEIKSLKIQITSLQQSRYILTY